jgi:hypothetical protein
MGIFIVPVLLVKKNKQNKKETDKKRSSFSLIGV